MSAADLDRSLLLKALTAATQTRPTITNAELYASHTSAGSKAVRAYLVRAEKRSQPTAAISINTAQSSSDAYCLKVVAQSMCEKSNA